MIRKNIKEFYPSQYLFKSFQFKNKKGMILYKHKS